MCFINCDATILCRFHAYAVTIELNLYERSGSPSDSSSEPSLVQRKKIYGGSPSEAGVRQDVMLVFGELEEAKNILSQIQAIVKEREKNGDTGKFPLFQVLDPL